MAARENTPSIREIAELTARLRRLSTAGRNADPAERAAFLADKHNLLARIEAANRPSESVELSADDTADDIRATADPVADRDIDGDDASRGW